MNFEDGVRGIAFTAGIMDVQEDSWTGVGILDLMENGVFFAIPAGMECVGHSWGCA